MGKPYNAEMEVINGTYNWALSAPIEFLQEWIASAVNNPLISVGSGGSHTAALFSALLHQHAGRLAISSTPLEIISKDFALEKTAVLFVTAGGRNQDLLRSFSVIVREEPAQLLVLCGTKNSPMKKLAEGYGYVCMEEVVFPWGKDGFLATNSLLGFMVLLARAYEHSALASFCFPNTLEALVYQESSKTQFVERLTESLSRITDKDTIIVLHGKWGKPVAFDLESKFVEAALGNLQIADYRNFAHGRHNWLNRKLKSTGVIALITPDDKEIANKTLHLLPEDVPVVRIESNNSGPISTIELLVKAFFIVKIFGQKLGIDPGAPHIPQFGRRLYSLIPPIPSEKTATAFSA